MSIQGAYSTATDFGLKLDVDVDDIRADKDLWVFVVSCDGKSIGLEVDLDRRKELMHGAFRVLDVDDRARPDFDRAPVGGLEPDVLADGGRRLDPEVLTEARRVVRVIVGEERRWLEVLGALATAARKEQTAHKE